MPILTASPADARLIHRIADRAVCLATSIRGPSGRRIDRLSVVMDLIAVHANGAPLDLAALLDAEEPAFVADVCGIQNNLDRASGRLTGGFAPRHAAQDQAEAA
jgi:hypothetical protein